MSVDESTREALRELYGLYADDIFRYALYTLTDESDALDTVQEVFLRAYRSWGTYRGEASAKTWLFRISRNYIYDLLRKRKTKRKYHTTQDPEESLEGLVDTAFVEVQQVLEVQEILHQLPDRYRQVLVLRAVEELSVAETGRILQMSDTNVRVTYLRAKKALEELLQDAAHGEDVKGGLAR